MTLQLNYVSHIVPSDATKKDGPMTTGKATNGIGRFERDGKSLVVNATRRVLRTAAVK
jgi:hypothetical protein